MSWYFAVADVICWMMVVTWPKMVAYRSAERIFLPLNVSSSLKNVCVSHLPLSSCRWRRFSRCRFLRRRCQTPLTSCMSWCNKGPWHTSSFARDRPATQRGRSSHCPWRTRSAECTAVCSCWQGCEKVKPNSFQNYVYFLSQSPQMFIFSQAHSDALANAMRRHKYSRGLSGVLAVPGILVLLLSFVLEEKWPFWL